MPALSIEFHCGGVWLPQCELWLDPHRAQTGSERVFVSHAHADHIAAHREVLLTSATARLMRTRLRARPIEHVLDFGVAREFRTEGRPWRITMLPAGHILGSAMALVEAEGESLLYTGDFKLKPSRSAERCEPCPAEVLIMETTFGRLAYRFPPAEVVFRDVVAFCRKTLDHGETAVLLAYSMGKSQELLCGLAEAGLPIMLCDSVYKVTRVYESLGQRVPAYERFDPAQARGKVLIFPPSAGRSVLLRDLGRVRVAILTGWAVDSGCRFRHGADAAFPLSDHADFSGLVEMVRRVAPKKVHTMHGSAAEFAEALRWLGFDAQPLGKPNQLSLPLDLKEFVLAGLEREATPRESR